MTWTTERIELLTTLWNTGMGAGKIAKELGDDTTRNAVIGKARRLKLAPHTRGEKPEKPKREARSTPFRKPVEIAPPAEPYVPGKLIEAPVEQRKTLLELQPDSCRWPYGEPREESFYYCGAVSAPDQSYCPAHCRVAFQPYRSR